MSNTYFEVKQNEESALGFDLYALTEGTRQLPLFYSYMRKFKIQEINDREYAEQMVDVLKRWRDNGYQ